MRAVLCSLLVLCAASLVGAAPARAQTGPVIVVPGKPGVPVVIDGLIADGAVVYGDWGLAKPNNAGLIIEGPVAYAAPAAAGSPGYFPATGHQPRYGRLEIEPPARRARADTSFHREWSVESEFRKPVTEYPPFNPPPVILAPRERRSGRSQQLPPGEGRK
jgi:hypothetical protein